MTEEAILSATSTTKPTPFNAGINNTNTLKSTSTPPASKATTMINNKLFKLPQPILKINKNNLFFNQAQLYFENQIYSDTYILLQALIT